MDFPSQMLIKKEQDFTYIEENLDFNFDVKIEEIPLVGDWCVKKENAIESNENCVSNEVVTCDKLKDGYLQKCSRCSQWFSDSFELIKHNLAHIEIVTEKLEVPKTFQYFKSNKRKYNKKNGHSLKNYEISRFKCPKCDTNFNRRKDLNRHIKYIHEPKDITCDLCPTKVTNKDALKTHMRNCHTERVYCDICDSKLKSVSYLHAHMRRVHYDDGEVHSCDICNKIFKSPRYLKIHQKNSHRVESNKIVKGKGRNKRQNEFETECSPSNTSDEISPKIEYEEPISYEIEMPYEIALL